MGLHVREDVVTALGELRLPPLGGLGRQRRDADLRVAVGPRRLEGHVGYGRGHIASPVPRRDVAVALPGLAVARSQGADLKPGVTREQPDETLPDRAGGPEDRDLALAHR